MEKVTIDDLEKFAAALSQLRLCIRKNLTPMHGSARRVVWLRDEKIYAEGYFVGGADNALWSAHWRAEGEWARDLACAAPAARGVAPEAHFAGQKSPDRNVR